jgi:hypothetical protein
MSCHLRRWKVSRRPHSPWDPAPGPRLPVPDGGTAIRNDVVIAANYPIRPFSGRWARADGVESRRIRDRQDPPDRRRAGPGQLSRVSYVAAPAPAIRRTPASHRYLQALCPLVEPTDADGGARTSGLTDLARLFSWLALLAYLALSLGHCRCLLVVTDRGDPVEAVRRFRAALHRADRVIDIRLAPLNSAEAAELVGDELGGEDAAAAPGTARLAGTRNSAVPDLPGRFAPDAGAAVPERR